MRGIILGDMKTLRKMTKDIDKGLPAFGKLLDETIEDIPNKAERIINASAKGFKKFFSPSVIK